MVSFIIGSCLCLVALALTWGLLAVIYYAIKTKQFEYYKEIGKYKRN